MLIFFGIKIRELTFLNIKELYIKEQGLIL